jgi:hypothetical protein
MFIFFKNFHDNKNLTSTHTLIQHFYNSPQLLLAIQKYKFSYANDF